MIVKDITRKEAGNCFEIKKITVETIPTEPVDIVISDMRHEMFRGTKVFGVYVSIETIVNGECEGVSMLSPNTCREIAQALLIAADVVEEIELGPAQYHRRIGVYSST